MPVGASAAGRNLDRVRRLLGVAGSMGQSGGFVAEP